MKLATQEEKNKLSEELTNMKVDIENKDDLNEEIALASSAQMEQDIQVDMRLD